jgi:hypothetical protein
MDIFHRLQIVTAACTICSFVVLVIRSWLERPELWEKFQKRVPIWKVISTIFQQGNSQNDEDTQDEPEVQEYQIVW